MYFDGNRIGYPAPAISVIARGKLNGLGEHWGIRQPDGSVIHSTRAHGVHVVGYDEFAAGKDVRVVRQIPVSEYMDVLGRIQQELADPIPYDLIENNPAGQSNSSTSGRVKFPHF